MAPANNENVRLQLFLCAEVATELNRHASELQRSNAWVAAWALRVALDDRGGFGSWMTKRMKGGAKHKEWVSGRDSQEKSVTEKKEFRLQLQIEAKRAEQLEQVAAAINQSSLKLGALMIQFSITQHRDVLRMMKTGLGRAFRRLVVGEEDFKENDVPPSDEGGETSEGDTPFPEENHEPE